MSTCVYVVIGLFLSEQGRWLHLFQLVEKQYQEQILAQQEQYQCQIQVSWKKWKHMFLTLSLASVQDYSALYSVTHTQAFVHPFMSRDKVR